MPSKGIRATPQQYLTGITVNPNGASTEVAIPRDCQFVEIRANGGAIYFQINGIAASATSPGYVADGAFEYLGPLCNLNSLHVFAAAGVLVGINFYRAGVGSGVASMMDYEHKVLAYDPDAYWMLTETTGTTAVCQVNAAQNGTYARDVSVMGTGAGIGDGNTAPLFDGTNDFINAYSAALAAVYDQSEVTIMSWCRVFNVGVWTDGSNRRTVRFYIDANNDFQLSKDHAVNNRIVNTVEHGGVIDWATEGGVSETGWMCWISTVSQAADEVNLYRDGILTDTEIGLGVWAGPLGVNTTILGARDDVPAGQWYGWIAHVAIFGSAFTQPQITDLSTV